MRTRTFVPTVAAVPAPHVAALLRLETCPELRGQRGTVGTPELWLGEVSEGGYQPPLRTGLLTGGRVL